MMVFKFPIFSGFDCFFSYISVCIAILSKVGIKSSSSQISSSLCFVAFLFLQCELVCEAHASHQFLVVPIHCDVASIFEST